MGASYVETFMPKMNGKIERRLQMLELGYKQRAGPHAYPTVNETRLASISAELGTWK